MHASVKTFITWLPIFALVILSSLKSFSFESGDAKHSPLSDCSGLFSAETAHFNKFSLPAEQIENIMTEPDAYLNFQKRLKQFPVSKGQLLYRGMRVTSGELGKIMHLGLVLESSSYPSINLSYDPGVALEYSLNPYRLDGAPILGDLSIVVKVNSIGMVTENSGADGVISKYKNNIGPDRIIEIYIFDPHATSLEKQLVPIFRDKPHATSAPK